MKYDLQIELIRDPKRPNTLARVSLTVPISDDIQLHCFNATIIRKSDGEPLVLYPQATFPNGKKLATWIFLGDQTKFDRLVVDAYDRLVTETGSNDRGQEAK